MDILRGGPGFFLGTLRPPVRFVVSESPMLLRLARRAATLIHARGFVRGLGQRHDPRSPIICHRSTSFPVPPIVARYKRDPAGSRGWSRGAPKAAPTPTDFVS